MSSGSRGVLDNWERQARTLAIMSGHVAQFILTDADWLEALAGVKEALRPGGYLAFESRDPRAREWNRWTGRKRIIPDSPYGRIKSWTEVTNVEGEVVYAVGHRRLLESNEDTVPATESIRDRGSSSSNDVGDSCGEVLPTEGHGVDVRCIRREPRPLP